MPARPTERFDAVGQCIYCSATSGLTDEHIVPAAIDGNWVLPTSSCIRCAEITSGFESQYLNSIRVLRSGLSLGSRRRKTKPRTAPINVVLQDGESLAHVPLNEHPLEIGLPVFVEPGCLRSGDPITFSPTKIQVITFGKSATESATKRGAKAIKFNFKVPHEAFGRMLAKIGYSCAVAQYGLDAFTEVFVLPAIRGESSDVGQWVGCYNAMEEKAADPDSLHRINVSIVEFSEDDGSRSRAALARIQLFCNSPSPGYVVVVGRVIADRRLTHRTASDDASPWPMRGDLQSLRGIT